MDIRIEPTASVPVSDQIAEGIRFAIAAGRTRPGDRLPSVRALARKLLVNPNTVAKVYRDLERERILRTKPGSGVFVGSRAGPPCRRASRDAVREAVREAFRKARDAGLDDREIADLLECCLEDAGALRYERT